MRNKLIWTLISVLILLGVGLIVYPEIAFLYYNRNVESMVEIQEKTLDKLNKDTILNEFNKAKSYNNLLVYGNTSNFSEDKSAFEKYESCLNVDGNGVMGFIDIPKINVNLPIFHGTSKKVLEIGAGHMENTVLPIGEKNTNSIITAHTGHPRKRLFTDLTKLSKKDLFYLNVLGKKFVYQVVDAKVIDPDELNNEDKPYNGAFVTLLTCYPYGVNTHRLLVKGKMVNVYSGQNNKSESAFCWKWYFAVAIFGLIVTVIFIYHHREKDTLEI